MENELCLARMSRRLYVELSQQLDIDIEFQPTGTVAVVESAQNLLGMVEMIQRPAPRDRDSHCARS